MATPTSVCSTPSKKRKTEQSWHSIVTRLDVPEDSDIIELLETMGPIDCVKKLSYAAQKVVLTESLGEERCTLVDQILEFTSEEMKSTLLDQVMNGELAPSYKLKTSEVLEVLTAIIQLPKQVDYIRFIDCLKDLCDSTELEDDINVIEPSKLTTFVDMMKFHHTKTLNIGNKEASGIAMLGNFIILLVELFTGKFTNHTFYADHQPQIGKYIADEAIVTIVDGEKPLIYFEYKPAISPNLLSIYPSHLCKMFLQAFYLRRKCAYPVLHCLTDMEEHHYFIITGNRRKISIVRYFHFKASIKKESELRKHINFLCKTISSWLD